MDDRAGSKKQQRLEECVCVEVEDTGGVGPHPHRQEHVAELRHRRVGQHALDIVLDEADRSRHQRGRDADPGDDLERHRRVREEDGVAANHVHARGDHRGRMDQGGDGRWPLHGVRQPHMQRQLGRLAGGADEQEERGDRHHAHAERLGRPLRGRRRHGLEVQAVEGHEDQEHPEDEPEVADAVDDKRLLASVRRRLLRVVEADEQVRAETDTLPPDEHDREVGAEHEHEHEGREQVQVREVARVLAVGLLVHVAGRVDVDERSDAGDDEDHQRRELIQPERERYLQGP